MRHAARKCVIRGIPVSPSTPILAVAYSLAQKQVFSGKLNPLFATLRAQLLSASQPQGFLRRVFAVGQPSRCTTPTAIGLLFTQMKTPLSRRHVFDHVPHHHQLRVSPLHGRSCCGARLNGPQRKIPRRYFSFPFYLTSR